MTKVGKIKFANEILKELEPKALKALALTVHALQEEVRDERIIPRDQGALQGEKFFIDESTLSKGYVSLVFEGPYARRLYYHPEYHFQRESTVDLSGKQHGGNINAQAYWMTPWLPGGKYEKRPAEIFEALLKKEL